jgi:DNA repair protein RecO (recombination protein O)
LKKSNCLAYLVEWQGPAIVLAAAPYGEGDALATVLCEDGAWRGLARGGSAKSKSATWQTGNIVAARWVARLSDQLGSLTAELVHPTAALAMPDPDALAVLEAACALAAGALPEREAHGAVFAGLTRLCAGIAIPDFSLSALVRWEVLLLKELGYGLDLSGPTTGNDRLAFVSPRTGRAVTLSQAGEWVDRLLPLPGFLLDDSMPDVTECLAGLRLTQHFLARHLPLPRARLRLYDRVSDQVGATRGTPDDAG